MVTEDVRVELIVSVLLFFCNADIDDELVAESVRVVSLLDSLAVSVVLLPPSRDTPH